MDTDMFLHDLCLKVGGMYFRLGVEIKLTLLICRGNEGIILENILWCFIWLFEGNLGDLRPNFLGHLKPWLLKQFCC